MANSLDIQDLLEMEIVWTKVPDRSRWVTLVNSETCELMMNDFPEEPLYTLVWREKTLDFDDAPASWLIPRGK